MCVVYYLYRVSLNVCIFIRMFRRWHSFVRLVPHAVFCTRKLMSLVIHDHPNTGGRVSADDLPLFRLQKDAIKWGNVIISPHPALQQFDMLSGFITSGSSSSRSTARPSVYPIQDDVTFALPVPTILPGIITSSVAYRGPSRERRAWQRKIDKMG